jgi:hypothetical protein
MSLNKEEDEEVVVEADDIASKMIGILVGKFKEREGRDPTAEEVGQLLEELTEERVAELLGMEERGKEDDEKEEEREEETCSKDNAFAVNSSNSDKNNGSCSNRSNNIDEEVPSQEADDIASGILKILTDKFKEKTGAPPTEDDVAKMLEEMTEERVAELLGEEAKEMSAEVSEERGSPKRKMFQKGEEEVEALCKKQKGDCADS